MDSSSSVMHYRIHAYNTNMPQLDTLTYFTQVFWVFVTFTVFYAVCLRHILPGISRILKVRKKKLEYNKNAMDSFVDEERSTATSYEQMLAESLNASRSLLLKTAELGTSWLSFVSVEVNKTSLKSMNESYLRVFGSLSAKRHLMKELYSK